MKIGFISLFILGIQIYSVQSQNAPFIISPSMGYTLNNQTFDDTSGTFLYHGAEGGLGIGYFIHENFRSDFKFNYFKYTYKNDGHFTSPGFFLGASLSYIKSISEKFNLPVSVGAGYSQFNSNDTFETYIYKGYGARTNIGIEYLLSRKIGLILNIGTQLGKLKTEYQDLIYTLNYLNYEMKLGANFYLETY